MSESASSNLPKEPPPRRTEGDSFALVPCFERSRLEWASEESATIAA